MIKVWNEERDNYLIEIHKGKLNQEITDLFNKRFGTNLTSKAISSRKRKLNLVSCAKYQPKYPEEIKNYVKENHRGKSTIELAAEVSKVFNIDANADSIQNLKSKIRINEGFIFEPARNDGCIKKGNVPSNKGKKWDEYLSKEKQERCRKTTFKKGNKPLNYRPIGSERINVDGYTEIKVEEPDKWDLKHRIIYAEHNGPIPKGYKVIFADGNKLNLEIDNLILVSNAEELIMNRNRLIFDDKELTKTGANIAKVIDKTNKLKSGKN